MQAKEHELQRKREEEVKATGNPQFKMKRFASVESKLGQAVVGGGGQQNYAQPIVSSSPAMNQPGKKMTKAE